jgi:Predicted 3'-5' exonuclease related to the exonuclease domain of PolB
MQLESRDSEPRVLLCRDETSERHALEAFWAEVATPGNRHHPVIGFTVLAFDLPVIARRSMYLSVWPSRNVTIDRYRSQNVIDLLLRLTFNGLLKPHSLDFYGRRLELEINAPELRGSDIAAYVAANDWASVEAHCRSDVHLTYALAERLRYIHFDEDADDEALRSERRSA